MPAAPPPMPAARRSPRRAAETETAAGSSSAAGEPGIHTATRRSPRRAAETGTGAGSSSAAGEPGIETATRRSPRRAAETGAGSSSAAGEPGIETATRRSPRRAAGTGTGTQTGAGAGASSGAGELGGRRLTARSVLASTLLGVSPPELPTRSLVATAELLGVAPGTARVAISRMVAAGELEAAGDGYRLVGPPLLARQSRQSLSRTGPPPGWDGSWRLLVVTGDARPAPERAELRAALGALRFGELREGVWLRPANLPVDVLPDAEARAAERCTSFPTRPDQPAELAAALWDLDGWAGRAATLRTHVDRSAARLAERDPTALAEGFVVSAAVLRHLQADPLLPAELTGPAWPGPGLRTAHQAYDAAFKSTLTSWLRSHLAR